MHAPTTAYGHETLLRACGLVGVLGCIGVVVGNIAGVLIYEQHDWVADTISNLAAGRYEWIQDVGLVMLGVGIAACALGLSVWRVGGLRRGLVITALAVLAVDVVVIALYNEYGDGDTDKVVIHDYAVYALGGLFAVAAWGAARPLGTVSRRWRHFSYGIAIAWVIMAPVFFVIPTGWDGLYERILGLVFLAWVGAVSWLLLRRGERRVIAD